MFNSKEFLASLSIKPGVYCMYDKHSAVLYIGKAKNLKNRVSSYFKKAASDKIINMVAKIDRIEVTVTSSEREALLLESTLIKTYKPKYNVVLRDDKDYPYIFISLNNEFPRVNYYRGKKKSNDRYFGPYTNSSDVKDSLKLLQKLFRLRTCSDSFFKNRSRPCLLYQIKLCSAPCVGYITAEDYSSDLKDAVSFLEGKNNLLIPSLMTKMQDLSLEHKYEQAALVRDKISALRHIAEQQAVKSTEGDADVIACKVVDNLACIYVLPIRLGNVLSGKAYFPKVSGKVNENELLYNFILAFYLNAPKTKKLVNNIIISHPPEDKELLLEAINEKFQQKIKFVFEPRGVNRKRLELANTNVSENLKVKLSADKTYLKRFEDFIKAFNLDLTEIRIECFDVSHTQGENTYASCVVFSENGPLKKEYRLFKLDENTNSDDYKGMQEALSRRFKGANPDKLPDVLLIDGGKGQLNVAQKVLEEYDLNEITLLAIAKGEGRKAGLETIFIMDNKNILRVSLEPISKALHFLQRVRDEAHRFAITAHRKKRAKTQLSSPLDKIEGIGPKKKQALLAYFGGWQEISSANVDEIKKVPGISKILAELIYTTIHGV